MKKINKLQLGITLITILIAYSCKKDVITPDDSSIDSTAQEDSNVMQQSQAIERKLLNFKTELKNHKTQKSGEPTTYEVDSVIWYLESTLNYTYSNPSEITREHMVDSFEVILAKTTDGEVDMAEIQRAYNESVNSLSVIYNAVSYSDKIFKMSDIEILSENIQEITLKVKGDVGNRVTMSSNNGITSGWAWGHEKGYYINGQVLFVGFDAIDVIKNQANYILSPPPAYDAYGNPFTAQQAIRMVVLNPVVVSSFTCPYAPPFTGLSWQGQQYGPYGANGTRPVTLLSSAEINTYISGTVTIATMPTFQGSNPPPAFVEMAEDYPLGIYPYPHDKPAFHSVVEITYGDVIWVSSLTQSL